MLRLITILGSLTTTLAVLSSGFVPQALRAAAPDSVPEVRSPLPGMISNPTPLAGNRRWQMFTKNPGRTAGGVGWSPDGNWLAIATGRMVRIFQVVGAPEFQKVLVGHTDFVRAVRFSPNGELIATASLDGTVRIWDANGREQRAYREHEDGVQDVAWHPDGKRLASASLDGSVRIWSVEGTTIATLNDHEAPVNAVAWSPDGKWLTSGCQNKVIRFWSPEGQKGPIAEGHIGSVESLAWNFDGSQLLSCDHGIESSDNEVSDMAHMKIWDVNGHEISSTTIDRPMSHVAWSPDGKVALGGGSRSIWMWNSAEGKPAQRRALGMGVNVPVAWRPSGDLFIAGPQLHDKNGTNTSSIPLRNIELCSISQNPDGSILTVGRTGNLVYLYDADGKQIRELTLQRLGNFEIAPCWSPDGKTFIPCQRLTNTLQRYDAAGNIVGPPISLPSDSRSIDWSHDGKFLAVGGDGMIVMLVDLENSSVTQIGKQLHGITQVRFTPDQQQICSAGFDGCVRFWSRDGKPEKVFEAVSTSIRGLAWARDGKSLATGSEDGLIRFWNMSGEIETVAGGHGGFIESLDFNSDSTALASGSWDHTVRIWNRDGSPVTVLRGHEGSVFGVQWAREGRRVYSSGNEGAIRLWDVTTGETEWQSLLGLGGGYVTIDSHGRVKHGNEKILDSDFVFFAEDDQGRLINTKWADIRAEIQPDTTAANDAK